MPLNRTVQYGKAKITLSVNRSPTFFVFDFDPRDREDFFLSVVETEPEVDVAPVDFLDSELSD